MTNDKFKALVLYIIHWCRDPRQLGAIRLNKALWYADVAAYQLTGASITGIKYIKMPFGPVPKPIKKTLADLVEDNKIEIQDPENEFDVRKFFSLESPNDASLNAFEKGVANVVLDAVCGYSANHISEMSHDVVWQAAAMGEEIPLYASYAANKGVVTDEIRAIVIEKVKQLEATS